jgi:redox-sensitive bicupin YhaK (pirin superfamily)
MEKMIIRRAGERGYADHGWLRSWHTFSFADYYDEAWMGFRTLRVINEDFIAPGKGFDLHGHRDMEILTYVMSGALRHVDTMGNNEIIRAGEFQRMTAGTGVQHMEVSATQTEETHLYQIWILPNEKGLTPSYEQKAFPLDHPGGGRGPASEGVLIASPDGRDGSLTIHQDVDIRLYRLEAGETATIEVPAGKAGWVQIVEGEVEVGGESLRSGDAAGTHERVDITGSSVTMMLVFLL